MKMTFFFFSKFLYLPFLDVSIRNTSLKESLSVRLSIHLSIHPSVPPYVCQASLKIAVFCSFQLRRCYKSNQSNFGMLKGCFICLSVLLSVLRISDMSIAKVNTRKDTVQTHRCPVGLVVSCFGHEVSTDFPEKSSKIHQNPVKFYYKKLATPHQVRRAKSNNQPKLCEAPKRPVGRSVM